MPVFSAVMNLIRLLLRTSDMFQFTTTSSLSYITPHPDLKQYKALILHLADAELISVINI